MSYNIKLINISADPEYWESCTAKGLKCEIKPTNYTTKTYMHVQAGTHDPLLMLN
jgi:hypothetical protein